jgi:predicted TIM-barrel fold metal-dependent hydrolase
MTGRAFDRFVPAAAGVLLLAACTACTAPADGPDAGLVAYIDGIKAVDAHAHPLRYVAPGAPPDTEFDALPLDKLPPFAVPSGLRPEHPQYRDAQHALYGMSLTDTGAAYAKALEQARGKVMQEQGAQYPAWALDHAGIDIMLSNRIVMGAGLDTPRFRWVPFDDALMLPLDVRGEAALTPDTRSLYPLEARLLARYLHDLSIAKIPATLDAFERDIVAPTVKRQKQNGAVGIKFEAAYLRSLDFAPADSQTARAIYARYAAGGVPTHAEYTTLENHLFRVIAREAGRNGLTIQIHATEGFGGFYSMSGSSPLLLESAFNDSTLRGTNFVITHGGWPRVRETQLMLGKPNVYADISMMDILSSPHSLSAALRDWLSEWPEKILFGSDAFDGGAAQGWEQIAWVASRNARLALATALTGMVRDKEITLDRAKVIARMVLRDNAMAAYHLAGK